VYSSDDQSQDGVDDDDDEDDYDVPPAFCLDLSNVAGLSPAVGNSAWTTADKQNARSNDDDDDDDDYDVPPAFRRDSSDVARLSSLVESDAWPTDGHDNRDTYDDDDDDDDDDDYDVPPAFRLDLSDVRQLSSCVEADACDTNSHDDDDNYDVLPNTLRPTTPDFRRRSSLNHDVDECYDYLTTKPDLTAPLSPDTELYDFIAPRDDGWSDDVAQKTSTIVPDIDDDLYDYIGADNDAERQLIGGDKDGSAVGNFEVSTACDDELYDYPPLHENPESVEAAGRVAEGSGNCLSSAENVLERKTSTSDEHYDVVPIRRASSSDQLPVRRRSVSEEVCAKVADEATGVDRNNFIATKSARSGTGSVRLAVDPEAAGTSKDSSDDDSRGPPSAVHKRQQSSSPLDEHYDILPCRAATLSARKPCDSTDAAASHNNPPRPPTSSSTLPSSLPGQPCRQNLNRTTEQTVDTTGHSAVKPFTSGQSHFSPTSPNNKPSPDSTLTTVSLNIPLLLAQF